MIPHTLHQIWQGPTDAPDEFWDWREELRFMHPRWNHYFWTNVDARDLVNADLYEHAEVIAPGNEWQFRADLLRYEILAREGGVYVDMDCEPLKPFDALLDEGHSAFVGWEREGVWANNAVMGATPGHPFLTDLVAGLPEWVERHAGPNVRPNVLSGPQYLTPRLTSDVHVYPQAHFYPYSWADIGSRRERGPFPDSYVVHHWANTRKRTIRKGRSG